MKRKRSETNHTNLLPVVATLFRLCKKRDLASLATCSRSWQEATTRVRYWDLRHMFIEGSLRPEAREARSVVVSKTFSSVRQQLFFPPQVERVRILLQANYVPELPPQLCELHLWSDAVTSSLPSSLEKLHWKHPGTALRLENLPLGLKELVVECGTWSECEQTGEQCEARRTLFFLTSLTKLDLSFDGTRGLDLLPQALRELRLAGQKFQLRGDKIEWPETLEVLRLELKYGIWNIPLGALPSRLHTLELLTYFEQQELVLPPSLTKLRVNTWFGKFVLLPDTLAFLRVDNTGSGNLPCLPKNLRRLKTSENWRDNCLPPNLESLEVCLLQRLPVELSSSLTSLKVKGIHESICGSLQTWLAFPALQTLVIDTCPETDFFVTPASLLHLKVGAVQRVVVVLTHSTRLLSLQLRGVIPNKALSLPASLTALDLSGEFSLPCTLPQELRTLELQSATFDQMIFLPDSVERAVLKLDQWNQREFWVPPNVRELRIEGKFRGCLCVPEKNELRSLKMPASSETRFSKRNRNSF